MRNGRKEMIMLRSVTYAYRARDILAKYGIRAYVERVPEDLRQDGCGYGVAVYTGAQKAAVLAVRAGNDMVLATDFDVQIPAVLAAVEEGTIPMAQIDASVTRILLWKARLGLAI